MKKLLIIMVVLVGVMVLSVGSDLRNNRLKTRPGLTPSPIKVTYTTDAMIHKELASPMPSSLNTDDYFTYTVPTGWKKEIKPNGDTNYLIITTPDYKPLEPMESVTQSGVVISIFGYENPDPAKYFDQILSNHSLSYQYDIRELKIDGFRAFSMHEDYEGHHLFMQIAQKNHLWQMEIGSPSLAEENKHQSEIDSFINSIHFK